MRENATHEIEEKEKNRKVLLLSLFLHLMVFLFLFLPWFKSFASPELERPSGILVQFEREAGAQTAVQPTAAPEEKPVEEKVAPAEAKQVEAQEEVAVKSKTVTEEPAEIVATKKEVDDKAMEKAERAEAEARKKAAEEAAKAAQAEAARKKAEAEEKERQEYNNKKSKFSDLFGEANSDAGVGVNDDDSAGDPDASALDGLTSGKGTVGKGLGGRGIVFEPAIEDNSQKSGKVVIRVCVNKKGKVISKKYTQLGSTTSDSYLVDLALKSAAKYVFTESEIEEQCGDIVIDFKLM